MFTRLLGFALFFTTSVAMAAPFPIPTREMVYDTTHGLWLMPDEFSMYIRPADVVVMGEQHATSANKNDAGIQIHHGNQTVLLDLLSQRGLMPSVGMEFFDYTRQNSVDLFLSRQV